MEKKLNIYIRPKLIDAWKYVSHKKYLEKHIRSFTAFPNKIFQDSKPVFVLSTGRAGTELLTKILKNGEGLKVFHEPQPQLVYVAKLAHQMGRENIDALKIGFLGARYDIIKRVYLLRKRYVETNNHLTFFSPALRQLFPNAKFIHLVRHPGAFIRSGMRRNYYINNPFDDGRIVPRDNDPLNSYWHQISQIEKIAWLWNETNHFIEEEKKQIGMNRILQIRGEDLFTNVDTTVDLFKFLAIPVPNKNKLAKLISRPKNIQYKGKFPHYKLWSNEIKNDVNTYLSLAEYYGYTL